MDLSLLILPEETTLETIVRKWARHARVIRTEDMADGVIRLRPADVAGIEKCFPLEWDDVRPLRIEDVALNFYAPAYGEVGICLLEDIAAHWCRRFRQRVWFAGKELLATGLQMPVIQALWILKDEIVRLSENQEAISMGLSPVFLYLEPATPENADWILHRYANRIKELQLECQVISTYIYKHLATFLAHRRRRHFLFLHK